MRVWLPTTLLASLLLALSAGMPVLEPLFNWVQPGKQQVIYDRESFLFLLQNHLMLVVVSAAVGTLVAVAGGIFVTRPFGRDFLPLVGQVASIGQTFPPVAVLALAVPVLGFGEAPILLALVLYGLLPILRNTLAGLEGINPAVREAALGMGMSPVQVLVRVELPLAGRVIPRGYSNLCYYQYRDRRYRLNHWSPHPGRSGDRRAGERQYRVCAARGDSDRVACADNG